MFRLLFILVLVGCSIKEEKSANPRDMITNMPLFPFKSTEQMPQETAHWKPQNRGVTDEDSKLKVLMDLLKSGKTCDLAVRFGLYQHLGVMRLTPQKAVANNPNIQITGKYFYLKHGKPIDVMGILHKTENKLKISESFEGKKTGYFEFSSDKSRSNFWSAKKNGDSKEAATLVHACESKLSVPLSRSYFHRPHKTQDMGSLKGDGKIYDVEDWVWVTKLSDGHIAFYVYVIGGNFHTGKWDGIAKSTSTENAYIHDSIDTASYRCVIPIFIKPKQSLTMKDVDCDGCCGHRATLNWEYTFKAEMFPLTPSSSTAVK